MRLGIIARCDNTGLGNQTRELVEMLNPDKVLVIDSTFFNNNKQNKDWYQGYNHSFTRSGFPKRGEMINFLEDLDVVFSCETFYNSAFIEIARNYGVKTILQYNYEFLINLQDKNHPLPDVLIAPSLWNFDEIEKEFSGQAKVVYIPPPTNTSIFDEVRKVNLSKTHNRILHVGGKKAAHDRNGTDTIIEMLKYSREDYELVVTSQTMLEKTTKDKRLSIFNKNIKDRQDIYMGFDAMILPRRYAGLCLPMNESLISGMPVFMTDISPNNIVLPKEWLVKSEKVNTFRAKSMIDVYAGNPKELANLVDNFIGINDKKKSDMKNQAVEIGLTNFSVESVKDKYIELINLLK